MWTCTNVEPIHLNWKYLIALGVKIVFSGYFGGILLEVGLKPEKTIILERRYKFYTHTKKEIEKHRFDLLWCIGQILKFLYFHQDSAQLNNDFSEISPNAWKNWQRKRNINLVESNSKDYYLTGR